MRRRAFLAALAAGSASMAGCSVVGLPESPATGDEQTPTITPAPPPTTSPTPDPSPGSEPPPDWADVLDDVGRTSIIDLETNPRTYALGPTRYRSRDGGDIRLAFAATATPEHPARLVASLQNANPFENTFRLDWTPPFGRLHSDHPREPGAPFPRRDHTYRDTLVFVPTANHELVDHPPSVERADDGQWRTGGGAGFDFPETVQLESEETVYGEYHVVGRLEGVGNGRPTGIYEFSRGQDGAIPLAAWETERPGPTETSRFAGESVPEPRNRASIAWYHDADPATPSYVQPSTEQTDFPAAIDFTFVNHDREVTQCGHWDLYKRHGGRWFHLGPYVRTADCRLVPPGGAKVWTLHAYHGEGLPTTGAHTYDYLGGGRYAAVAGYGHATSNSGAMVELVGDPVEIVPTDDVTVERSDGTVTVTAPGWDDSERDATATLTLERAADADHALIAEQVMRDRFRGLRNTLAFFDDGVEAVVLRTAERVAESVVGYDAEGYRFRLADRGTAYAAAVDRGGSP